MTTQPTTTVLREALRLLAEWRERYINHLRNADSNRRGDDDLYERTVLLIEQPRAALDLTEAEAEALNAALNTEAVGTYERSERDPKSVRLDCGCVSWPVIGCQTHREPLTDAQLAHAKKVVEDRHEEWESEAVGEKGATPELSAEDVRGLADFVRTARQVNDAIDSMPEPPVEGEG